MSDILDNASDIAFAALEKAGNDPASLSISMKTVVVIYTAQAIIDNGGFQYFFGQDFDNNPPYSFIADAYRQIGARSAASLIEEAVSLFPFNDPHLHQDQRLAFLQNESNPDYQRIEELGDQLCGDESIWEKLEKYVNNNKADFKSA
jgi:hypothetical protein